VTLRFHKMHGAGNDFVVLDLRQQDYKLDAGTAKSLANRRTGIGCDQVLVIKNSPIDGQVAAFDIWNADGSQAGQCGNGARCIGLYLSMSGDAPAGPFGIGSPAGPLELTCLDDGSVRVNMGVPQFAAADIPVLLEPSNGWYTLNAGGEKLRFGACSMGNPHAVCIVDNAKQAKVAELGSLISRHAAFPQGCNTGFAELISRREIALRVFERGASETLACGSGACAAVVILARMGLLDEQVRVNQPGGVLVVEWKGGSDPVMMCGPAMYVFQGNVE
jgi:diaminopimelate epimerase